MVAVVCSCITNRTSVKAFLLVSILCPKCKGQLDSMNEWVIYLWSRCMKRDGDAWGWRRCLCRTRWVTVTVWNRWLKGVKNAAKSIKTLDSINVSYQLIDGVVNKQTTCFSKVTELKISGLWRLWRIRLTFYRTKKNKERNKDSFEVLFLFWLIKTEQTEATVLLLLSSIRLHLCSLKTRQNNK